MIVINPIGGLCNYLRVIFSYYRMAVEKNEKLVVIWRQTDVCTGFFLDYFHPVEGIEFISHNINNYKHDYRGCYPHANYAPDYTKLKVLEKIKSIILIKQQELEYNYIAVHIRRTDFIPSAISRNVYVSDEDFCRFIDKNLIKNLYIATDNKETYDTFKSKYNSYIPFNYHNTLIGVRRHTSLEDSIIDLYMCVYALEFMGSKHSSFSDLINALRELEVSPILKYLLSD